MTEIWVIGGGLAGSEAAWQIARSGCRVRLFEMRPAVKTPAHQTHRLGELVCSNSLKSDVEGSPAHQLKWELRCCDSLLMSVADSVRVPAGAALAVDRDKFSDAVTTALQQHPSITIERCEIQEIPAGQIAIIATGPLTSPKLSDFIQALTGEAELYFYDAISPIIEADSICWEKVFRLSRYGRGTYPSSGMYPTCDCKEGDMKLAAKAGVGNVDRPPAENDDYVNCPMTREEFKRFYDELIHAESVPLKEFERAIYFESCLPIEELARRGLDTLRFGPMKPVGLKDPRTANQPYAVVQLRRENLIADAYNLVGFQNHLRYGEQRRVLRLIPGLEHAEFLRYGQIHRNTFIHAPRLLNRKLQLNRRPEIYFAGQICGVEGYVESLATGLVASWNVLAAAHGEEPCIFPRETAIGSLVHYITEASPEDFQPTNINFGLFPAIEFQGGRQRRRERQIERARQAMGAWLERRLARPLLS